MKAIFQPRFVLYFAYITSPLRPLYNFRNADPSPFSISSSTLATVSIPSLKIYIA